MCKLWIVAIVACLTVLPAASAFCGQLQLTVAGRTRAQLSISNRISCPVVRQHRVRKTQSCVTSIVSLASGTAAPSAKAELLNVISQTNMGSLENADAAKKIDVLIDQLADQPCQFNPSLVDGEWALVFTRNAKGSPLLQQATQKVEKLGGSFANFAVEKGEFYNIAEILGGVGTLTATVAFGESPENAGKRITCDIVDAGIKLWSLPRIPLPLRASGGWLDFLYLDEREDGKGLTGPRRQDMRITRGNRGGLFVHLRPAKLRALYGAGAQ